MPRFKIDRVTKLDKRIKKQWIKALKSGDYEQGKGALKQITVSGPKYSVLGVLVEVLQKENIIWLRWKYERKGMDGLVCYSIDGQKYFLPYRVATKAKIQPAGKLNTAYEFKGKRFWTLSDLEESGASFRRIAKIIKEQF